MGLRIGLNFCDSDFFIWTQVGGSRQWRVVSKFVSCQLLLPLLGNLTHGLRRSNFSRTRLYFIGFWDLLTYINELWPDRLTEKILKRNRFETFMIPLTGHGQDFHVVSLRWISHFFFSCVKKDIINNIIIITWNVNNFFFTYIFLLLYSWHNDL